MLEITKSAIDKIAEYFTDKEVSPIRVYLLAGGCGLPSLALGLDEPKDTDHVFEIDGFKFIIDKEFMKEAEPIEINFTGFGFEFDCSLEFEEGCSGCQASGGCG
jgi:Fe-S cluster assembly iron-binding protein IscA